MTKTTTIPILFAGLFGALGVAGAAVAAHRPGETGLVAIAAAIALVHAPALLALGAGPASRWHAAAGAALIVGTILFSGDLAARAILGVRLFPMAAPAGGVCLIAGWLLVSSGAVASALARSERRRGS